jgi:predicted Fe-Mo cluster-binding NifX family protein
MKIAVASDGDAIARHFGRCECLLVFQVENGQVVAQETRPNAFTAFALGQCDHAHKHSHARGHGPIVNALRDCDLVLCYGMGLRAAAEMRQNGIQVALVGEEMTPENAVAKYLAGELKTGDGFCRCHD